MSKIIKCDICKKEINGTIYLIEVRKNTMMRNVPCMERDLCEKCLDKLLESE